MDRLRGAYEAAKAAVIPRAGEALGGLGAGLLTEAPIEGDVSPLAGLGALAGRFAKGYARGRYDVEIGETFSDYLKRRQQEMESEQQREEKFAMGEKLGMTDDQIEGIPYPVLSRVYEKMMGEKIKTELGPPTRWEVIHRRAEEIRKEAEEKGESLTITEALKRAEEEVEPKKKKTLEEIKGEILLEAHQRGEITPRELLNLSREDDDWRKWLKENPKAEEAYYRRKAFGEPKVAAKEPDIPVGEKIKTIQRWINYQELSDEQKEDIKYRYPERVPVEDYATIKTYIETLPKKYQKDYLRQIAPYAPKKPPTTKPKTEKEKLDIIFRGKGEDKEPSKFFW